ncbi:MAG TPA: FtsX-like permease family protein, partial [Clostridia bacterium]|nr:FtsX-like permease family protein [Clostridia bacterium]
SDIEYFKQISPDSNFLKAYNGFESYFMIGGYDSSLLGSLYFSKYFSGFVEADMTKEELLLTYGFTMEGELPKADNEIAITKYIYEYFKTGGCGYGYIYNKIDSVDDLIGENINVAFDGTSSSMKVTGVIDTKLNDTELAKYKDPEESAKMDNQRNEEPFNVFRYDTMYSFHSLAFVNKGFIENFGSEKMYFINKENIELNFVDSKRDKNALSYINKKSEMIIDKIEKSTTLSEKYSMVFFDENKPQLENDEILLPYNMLCSNLSLNIENSVKAFCNSIDNVPQAIKDMSQQQLNLNFQFYEYQCQNAIPVNSDYSNAYFQWLKNSSMIDTDYGDKLAIIKSINDEEIRKAILGKTAEDFDVSLDLTKSNITTTKNVKVVGCCLKEKAEQHFSASFICYEDNYNMVITEELMNELGLETQGAYNSLIGKMPTEPKEIKNLTKLIYTRDGDLYKIMNSATYDIFSADREVAPITKSFLYIAIGLAVFAMLLIMNYISTSITYKKRDIGILRAMGARGVDVFGIFFNEAFIIAAINFVLSVVATVVAISGTNLFFRNGMMLNITLFKVGILQVLLILGVCFVASTLASFLPVYSFSKKQPIEAIRNTLWTE